jgi:hypothetical protein
MRRGTCTCEAVLFLLLGFCDAARYSLGRYDNVLARLNRLGEGIFPGEKISSETNPVRAMRTVAFQQLTFNTRSTSCVGVFKKPTGRNLCVSVPFSLQGLSCCIDEPQLEQRSSWLGGTSIVKSLMCGRWL